MNAIVAARIASEQPLSFGRYDAGDLQRAMRSVLSRRTVRMVHDKPVKRSCASFDVRPDGRRVEL
jgi:hypothetical protein